MPARDALWRDHQRMRWLKPDARRWVKPDANRFLKPGVAIGALLPAFEAKYSPDQPREPAGSSEGGQWSDGSAGKEGGDIAFDDPDSDLSTLLDKLFEELPDFDLASILTLLVGNSSDGAGDLASTADDEPQVAIGEETTPPVLLVSDTNNSGNGNGLEPLPKIPEQRPADSTERTAILRNLSGWIGRNASAAGAIYGLADQIEWIGDYAHLIEANRDAPRTLEELQARANMESQRGYNKHHNVERSAVKDGISQSLIDDPSNILLIPELKHYEITGYYNSTKAQLPDGTIGSPREYLRDKSFEVRREFGLQVLRDRGVLK